MRATTEATKRTMTPEEEDRFYGINREGVPGYEFVVMDLKSIGSDICLHRRDMS